MKTVSRLALVAYLLGLAYFAFRPFVPVAGLARTKNGEFRAGLPMEDRKGSSRLRESLANARQMSLEVLLQTESLDQGGAARIISFSQHSMCRNFTLGQSGNGLSFRLRTTETDLNGMVPCLLVPKVFDARNPQHLVIVYDGEKVRLYVDGMLHAGEIELSGSFSNWGRNHLLTIGSEVSGEHPWNGTVEHFSIYGRALDASEVAVLGEGNTVPGAVYEFRGEEGEGQGMQPLKYRNLFVWADSGINLGDRIVNTVGFIPLAPLVWFVLPGRLKKRRFITAVLLPVLLGLVVSGTIEFSQRSIEGRVPCLTDLVYNVLGSLIGGGLLGLGLMMCKTDNEGR